MGPTCEVRLTSDDPSVLGVVDALVDSIAERVERWGNGRDWDLWIGGRPIYVSVDTSPPVINLSAGCNDAEDYERLRRLADRMTAVCGGLATGPIK